MGSLEVLGASGDVTVSWDPADPASVERARAEYDRLRAAGYLMFTVRRRADAFDPAAGALDVELTAGPPETPASSPTPPLAAVRPRRGRALRRYPGEYAEQSRALDPMAERVVAVPPMLGGGAIDRS